MKVVPWLLTFANIRLDPELETSVLRKHHDDGSTTPQPMQDGIPITDDYCEIPKNFSYPDTCKYIKLNSDACEGGGYLLWSKYVFCQKSTAPKVFLVMASIVFLVILMIMVSATADDFFSPCISGIVNHLKISESIAGVTFMAFGNGAPDIFGSIASVLSTDSPKADLAIGELLGAGIFVTLIVTAAIIFAQPFRFARRPTMRDLIFYLATLGLILFVFLYDDHVHVWQPAIALFMYLVYVATVFLGHFHHRRTKLAEKRSRRNTRIQSRIQSRLNSLHASRSHTIVNNVNGTEANGTRLSVPQIQIVSAAVERLVSRDSFKGDDREVLGYQLPKTTVTAPDETTLSVHELETGAETPKSFKSNGGTASPLGNGQTPRISIQIDPALLRAIEQEAEEAEDNDSEISDDVIVEHGHIVYSGPQARSRAQTMHAAPMKISTWHQFMLDIYIHLRPMTMKEFHEAPWYEKIYDVVKVPTVFILKATVPVSENAWSKAVAILQTLLAPFVALFCIEEIQASPPWGGPGFYVYCIGVSVVITVLLIVFTRQDTEPRFYNAFASFAGFLLSILWIYKIADEVVNIVIMLGVLSHLSHEILGLTVLAWSNSIGDLIADISVARQGYPKMAIAAVFGGQMFNLIIGFGVPFIIATARGTTVTITFSTIDHFLVIFLGVSLLTSLIALPIQRFHAGRPYAIVMVIIYASFIVFVVLAQTKVIKWSSDD